MLSPLGKLSYYLSRLAPGLYTRGMMRRLKDDGPHSDESGIRPAQPVKVVAGRSVGRHRTCGSDDQPRDTCRPGRR